MFSAWVVVAAAAAPFSVLVANRPMSRAAAERFVSRQQVALTPFNGPVILRFLQVTRRFRWLGTSAGVVFLVAVPSLGNFLFPVAGWFLGVLTGEAVISRDRGPGVRRRTAVDLAGPALVVAWRVCAALAAGFSLYVVARSFLADVGTAGRVAAACSLGTVLVVQVVVSGLRRRALPEGPADLVAAELATRSRTARSLLAAGSAVALWSVPYAELPDPLLGMVGSLPLVAWALAVRPWRAGWGDPGWPWPVPVAALVGVALFAWGPKAEDLREPVSVLTGTVEEPIAYASFADRHGWQLHVRERDDWRPIALGQAAPTGPNGERAPLTISGDGHRLVYLDRDTRRLVLHDLTHESDPRPITEPLTAAAPDPVFAQDGMSVVLTWPDGVEIVDVATAARTRPTGVGQVLGVGTYGMVATTGRRALPGAPDTVLLTLDRQGSVLTRVPFDPTVRAALTPDGRHLVTLSDGQVVTMDPRTGAVTRHARLTRLPEYYGTPSLTGWSGDGRLVVAIHPDDPGDAAFHLVDPVTGRAGQLKDAPDELDDVVLGRLP